MTYQTVKNLIAPLAVDIPTAAEMLGSTPSSLDKDRAVGHLGVPYVKAGRRVMYRLSDLEAWLEENRTTPLAEEQGGGK